MSDTAVQEPLQGAEDVEPQEDATPAAPAREREYVILESVQQGVWREKQVVTADSNDGALEAITDPNQQAKYQAIAHRNWSPKSPTVETVTTVKFK